MPNQSNSAGKAFYILLCAILGSLLFLVIQRALALIYYLLLNVNFHTYSFGLSNLQLSWINFLTVSGALFFGLWYGVWLGLHWYDVVYEQGQGGLFHGFLGHWLHREGIVKKLVPAANATAPVTTIKPVVKVAPAAPPVRLTDKLEQESWDLDELMKKELPAPESVSAPVVTKPKTVKARTTSPKRKTASKRGSAPTV